MSVLEMIKEVPKLTTAEQSLLFQELQKYLQPAKSLNEIDDSAFVDFFPYYEAENANHDLSAIRK
jgi:hypothetical protein